MNTPDLIARERECDELKRCMESSRSEFVIICGRRRVGKTFLVDRFFDNHYDFSFTGGHRVSTRTQLRNFAKALKKYAKLRVAPKFNDWYDAFDALEEYLESLTCDRKKTVFIDEMPWIDTLRSDFVDALENFWNGWANRRYDIVFIATGSATSWMADKLIDNQGGLHNRITSRLFLKPFTLKETEEYLHSCKIHWDRYQIMQAFMLTGGVPFYLSQLKPKLSIAQNIDLLCFEEQGMFRKEFDELYDSLFAHSESYINMVRLLYAHRTGMTKKEISKKVKYNGSYLKKVLNNLEQCNFISKRSQLGQKGEPIYRLVDFYTIFYFKFIEGKDTSNSTWWVNHINSSETLSWMGLTFELICMQHHEQIKRALSIAGMACDIYSWRQIADDSNGDKGAQIDMVIDRADHTISLCEMKFSVKKFSMTAEYEKKIRERGWIFQESTNTNKAVLHTFVTTYGISNPEEWDIVHSVVTMNDLFGT